jgi:hypothetical protein
VFLSLLFLHFSRCPFIPHPIQVSSFDSLDSLFRFRFLIIIVSVSGKPRTADRKPGSPSIRCFELAREREHAAGLHQRARTKDSKKFKQYRTLVRVAAVAASAGSVRETYIYDRQCICLDEYYCIHVQIQLRAASHAFPDRSWRPPTPSGLVVHRRINQFIYQK